MDNTAILIGYLSIPDKYEIVENPTYPFYQGEYTITPATYPEQALETKNKSMKQNLVIKKIPQYLVSNDTGKTLIIGDEYYNI